MIVIQGQLQNEIIYLQRKRNYLLTTKTTLFTIKTFWLFSVL